MSSHAAASATTSEAFHFCRVTRDDNRLLEERIVGSDEIHELGEDRLGLFAGGYRTIDMMERQLSILCRSEAAARWVVAVASKDLLADTECRLRERGDVEVGAAECRIGFRAGHLWFTTVEALSRTAPEILDGVILYDPTCCVCRGRKFKRYDGSNHDRPQIVANFLANRGNAGIAPLLCLMTLRPPNANSTAQIADAFVRNAWLFADPFSLSFVCIRD